MSDQPFSELRVLIIDGEDHVRDGIRKELASFAIDRVTEAVDGDRAMAAVAEPGADYDVILSALEMPGRDGIQTIRDLGAMGSPAAIIVMSIEDDRVIDAAVSLAAAQGLRVLGGVRKPVRAEDLAPLLGRFRAVALANPARRDIAAPAGDVALGFQRRELVLHYQPKIWARSGRFAGAEALVRWKHPQLGLIQPHAFVPMIEESEEFSTLLTDFCLQEAIACAGRWRSAGRELPISINLPARAFQRLDLPEEIARIADEHDVPKGSITLEITRSQLSGDAVRLMDIAIRMLDVTTRLRLKHFVLSVDGFGTGHAGLPQLQQMPFTEVKIDAEIVNGCSASPVKRTLVEASLALARNFKITSVAKGVEQRPDWDLLSSLGCDVIQGFFIARPMAEEGLEAWALQWMLREGAV